MKLIFTLLAVLLIAGHITAQNKPSKKFSSSAGISLGTTLRGSGVAAFGADIRFSKPISQDFTWTITPALSIFTKGYGSFVQLKSGLQIALSPKFYFSGETGIGFYLDGGETFILSPGLGTVSKNLDFSLRYERQSSYTSQLAFRLGIQL